MIFNQMKIMKIINLPAKSERFGGGTNLISHLRKCLCCDFFRAKLELLFAGIHLPDIRRTAIFTSALKKHETIYSCHLLTASS